MKNIIDAIVINGVKYNRVEAKTNYFCDECDLKEICSDNSYFAIVCACANEDNYMWKTNKSS